MNKFLQMRSLLSAALSFILVFLAGCQDNLDKPAEEEGPSVFTATIQIDEKTKTVLGEKDGSNERAVLWSSDDAIAVGKGAYRVKTGAGTAFATFTGGGATRDTDGKYHAYYPASLFEKGYLYLPEVQTYIPGRIDHLPMYAESDDTDLTFVNLCSVLQFDLICSEPMTVGKIVVQSRGGKKLSGVVQSLSIDQNATASLTMGSRALTQVTLDCGHSGVDLGAEPTSFHVAIPAQEYTSGQLQVYFYDTADKLIYHLSLKKDAVLESRMIYEIEKDLVQSMSFVIVTNETVGRVLNMPFLGELPAKLKIDWGDGSPVEVYEAGTDGSTISHRYDESRDDIPTSVTITSIGSGTSGSCLPRITLNPVGNQNVSTTLKKLLTELNTPLLPVNSESMNETFYECSNLTTICPDLFANNPQAKSFSKTFWGCTSLTSIPSDLFADNPKAEDFGGTFNKCKGLRGNIPVALFEKNHAATNFSGVFQDCTGLTGSIPAELFANNPLVTSFSGTFMGCTGLTGEIPSELFVNQHDVKTFSYVFQGCTRLTGTIPPELFADKPEVVDFQYTFAECMSLTGSIPVELFKGKPYVKVFYRTFRNCRNLTGPIPHDLFSDNPAVTNFSGVFAGCSGLSGEIPHDLFANQSAVTTFADTFSACSGLTGQIPHNLFATNPAVTSFASTFIGCSKLTGPIPHDLFSIHSGVTTFWATFQGCSGLTGEIPHDLFAGKPAVTSFASTFLDCPGLTGDIPSALFAGNPNVTTFFKTFENCKGLTSIPPDLFASHSSVTSFEYTFRNCTGLSGNAPALWTTHSPAKKNECFRYCIGLDNYADIPDEWK